MSSDGLTQDLVRLALEAAGFIQADDNANANAKKGEIISKIKEGANIDAAENILKKDHYADYSIADRLITGGYIGVDTSLLPFKGTVALAALYGARNYLSAPDQQGGRRRSRRSRKTRRSRRSRSQSRKQRRN